MNIIWESAIWRQFGAAIDMLDDAIVACPVELWGDQSEDQQFCTLHTTAALGTGRQMHDLYL
jgi:hypothetical protein